jgi:hypothetical protein
MNRYKYNKNIIKITKTTLHCLLLIEMLNIQNVNHLHFT